MECLYCRVSTASLVKDSRLHLVDAVIRQITEAKGQIIKGIDVNLFAIMLDHSRPTPTSENGISSLIINGKNREWVNSAPIVMPY